MEPINFVAPANGKAAMIQLIRHITGQGEQGPAFAPHVHIHTNADEQPV